MASNLGIGMASAGLSGGFSAAINAAFSPRIRAVQQYANFQRPNVFPTLEQMIAPYIQGFTSVGAFKQVSYLSGQAPLGGVYDKMIFDIAQGKLQANINPLWSSITVWDAIAASESWHPTLDLMLELNRRGYISESAFVYWCQRLGFSSDAFVPLIKAVGQFMPPVQDLVRFAVREVFNPDQRRILQLDEEYDQNPDFAYWAAAQGMTPVSIVTPNGATLTRDIARDYWAAHWQLPAPGQIFEMLHRLRPGRTPHFAIGGVVPDPVDVAFMRNAIKANDYAPTWRDRLAAIAYRLPGRIDIRRMLGLGIIDITECTELYKDLGYTDSDAGNLARLAEKLGPWKPSIQQAIKLRQQRFIEVNEYNRILAIYGVPDEYKRILYDFAKEDVPMGTLQRWRRKNLIDDNTFRTKAAEKGYEDSDITVFLREAKMQPWTQYTQLTRAQIAIGMKIGIMSADDAKQRLVQLGLSMQEANAAVAVIQLEASNEFVRKAVASARKSYLRGETNLDQARQQLTQIGITNDRIQQYLADWQVDLTASRRELSANQVVQALSRGLINVPTATARLINLNYSGEAINVYLSTANQNVQKAVALAAAKAARTAEEQRKAALSLVREQEKERRQAQRDLASHGTIGQLKRWFSQGLLTEQNLRDRLTFLGWPSGDQDRLIRDCVGKKCPAGTTTG